MTCTDMPLSLTSDNEFVDRFHMPPNEGRGQLRPVAKLLEAQVLSPVQEIAE